MLALRQLRTALALLALRLSLTSSSHRPSAC
eukprot:COSAG05_NODE_14960_length_382_cov_0.727915_1_plen_30_part_10